MVISSVMYANTSRGAPRQSRGGGNQPPKNPGRDDRKRKNEDASTVIAAFDRMNSIFMMDPVERSAICAKAVVQNQDFHELLNRSFVFLSFNVTVVTHAGLHFPNEVGLVEFTLREGIKSDLHCIINQPDIPMGYSAAAMKHSDDTHKIPVLDRVAGDIGGDGVKDLIVEILDKLPPPEESLRARFGSVRTVYCLPEHIGQVRGCLRYLADQNDIDDIKMQAGAIIPVNAASLLFELRGILEQHSCGLSTCEDDLTRTKYDYSSDTMCEYHGDLEAPNASFCAIGLSRRTAWLLGDVMCAVLNIPKKPGHYPMDLQDLFEVERELVNNVAPEEQEEDSDSGEEFDSNLTCIDTKSNFDTDFGSSFAPDKEDAASYLPDSDDEIKGLEDALPMKGKSFGRGFRKT